MQFKWLPWKFFVTRIARSHGFLDPIILLEQLQRFLQPSEINEPIELLRAGALMHARGLINSRVIQHNLDWIWPYWIERQFDPSDKAFIPRAFSLTHINLSNRNWTAVGLPDYPNLPIVDPRGLVTPIIDQWSIDSWLIADNGSTVLPSRNDTTTQSLHFDSSLFVKTTSSNEGLTIVNQTEVVVGPKSPVCIINIEAICEQSGWIVVALRPYNPEGISFIYQLDLNTDGNEWTINARDTIKFSEPAKRHHISDYRNGDVFIHLLDKKEQSSGECKIGMLSAVAMFKIEANTKSRKIKLEIPLKSLSKAELMRPWEFHLKTMSHMQIPNKHFQSLYETSIRTLLLHSSEEIYPGPYTYKRFWIRDAVFIINAMLCAGLFKRAEQAIGNFASKQKASGYFHSQEGEWDSNGQVLWILNRFCQLTNQAPKKSWLKMVISGANWILKKRLTAKQDKHHQGLMPAGFSAEHLGPNDYYYWDNFWSISGLYAAAQMCDNLNENKLSLHYQDEANKYLKLVRQYLSDSTHQQPKHAMPAAPNRRLDAGVIGSIVIGYPLQLCAENDPCLSESLEYLLTQCCFDNAFFQDMIHSGINPYLTLHMTQVLMRSGNTHFIQLLDKVAELASPTGQWPEAIHPQTGGGCMGDGQHVWAAAEWIMVMRNSFVREESDRLVLAAGIRLAWLASTKALHFGPAATTHGNIEIFIEPLLDTDKPSRWQIRWIAEWFDAEPVIEVCFPGKPVLAASKGNNNIQFSNNA